jgi:hypothetical protein
MRKSIYYVNLEQENGYESTFSHMMMAQRQANDIAFVQLLQVLLTRLID